ncbi:MAG: Xaa-Pro peptidase family protein [Spirochaetales bacterium]|nr:Xaa-Pro peptidase family protein [Spirochaetales bacterium]
MTRWERCLSRATERGADAVLITSMENRRYLSGFTGSNGVLYISPGRRLVITDQRYGAQAQAEAPGWEVAVHGLDRERDVARIVAAEPERRIAYEDTVLSVASFDRLGALVPGRRWIALDDEMLRLRSRKDGGELSSIRAAVGIAEDAFRSVTASIQPGVLERDLAAELDYAMAGRGSPSPAFSTIVASGIRSAYPHATPSETALAVDDLVTIDWGAVADGYHSDMTRVVPLGDPGARRTELCRLTVEAFHAALEALRPGRTCGEVDEAARAVFRAAGLEEYSLRGLGHGVGLAIHEYPRIVMDGTEPLEADMVFTIEPGVYLPGVGGVRVEQTVLLTDRGPAVIGSMSALVVEL